MLNDSILTVRQQKLVKLVNNNDFSSIHDLAVQIKVSEATVRRDLDELSGKGFIGRVHGGAVKLESTTYEPLHSEKMKKNTLEKQRIAAFAASLVHEGNSIFLDSGSTTLFIARELRKKKNLTIVTDNLDIATSVDFDASTTIILTGGMIRRNYSAVVGELTEDVIRKCKVDISFVACDAIDSERGMYNSNYLEIGVKKQIVNCGNMTILVADSTKFSSCSLAFVCPMESIDCIITDRKLDQDNVDIIRNQGIELHLV